MLVAKGLVKRLGAFHLGPVDFELGEEVLVVLGDNGSGKTTLLNLITGILKPDAGLIIKDNDVINSVPIEKRKIGYIFQNTCLFPHMRVRDNITYGLRNPADKTSLQHLDRVVKMLGVADLLDREVFALSGGEQQRVALARALAPQPDALVMDEPMRNLDFKTRRRLVSELKDLFTLLRVPTIYVTHDPGEAVSLGDTFLAMHKGRSTFIRNTTELESYLRQEYGLEPSEIRHYRMNPLLPLQRNGAEEK
jgi:ABC-type sugar transport system ATPase subunit